MNTKDILLVGAGLVAGYFLVGYVNKSKADAQATKDAQASADDQAKQAKIDSCNKSVNDYFATVRLASGADVEALKKAKFDACMSSTTPTFTE
jgi:outer membrane murein-binding lipoprotein Lpp